MRRIALTLAFLLSGAAAFAVAAGAESDRTYQAELFNAFGLVEGSELRVAGVEAGTVTDLDITEDKTALITFDVRSEFPEFTSEASCSSEPQSLIAEYFLDCQPGQGDQPLEGPIEAARNQITVQSDLVQNTLREPFKRRFQLILNEFGTALVGNGEKLNAAIRSGAPALRELREVLTILGRQNKIIAQLNVDSDEIFARLTDRREDVVRFIDEAEDTARVSAQRRDDLARDFDLLDDFLFELRPVMVELGNLAREQTPLLRDLRAAAPGLNTLGTNLPRFNEASRVSLQSLGGAAEVGRRALTKAQDEIAALNTSAQKAQPAGDLVARFLESLDDPRAAVEEDCDARTDLRDLPGEADRRVGLLEGRIGSQLTGSQAACGAGSGQGNPGYTGLEGLLNYAYVQTLSLNLFDHIGHGLAIQIVGAATESEGGECGEFSAGGPITPDGQHGGWPKSPLFGGEDGSNTRNIRQAAHCVAALGNYQPGITPGTIGAGGRTQFDPNNPASTLPKYPSQICSPPQAVGSTEVGICDPAGAPASFSARAGTEQPPQGEQLTDEEAKELAEELEENPEAIDLDKLREQLGLPEGAPLPGALNEALGAGAGSGSSTGSSDRAAATDLLDFLFGP